MSGEPPYTFEPFETPAEAAELVAEIVSEGQIAQARQLIIERLAVAARRSDEPWLEDDDDASWHARVFWSNLAEVVGFAGGGIYLPFDGEVEVL